MSPSNNSTNKRVSTASINLKSKLTSRSKILKLPKTNTTTSKDVLMLNSLSLVIISPDKPPKESVDLTGDASNISNNTNMTNMTKLTLSSKDQDGTKAISIGKDDAVVIVDNIVTTSTKNTVYKVQDVFNSVAWR